MNEGAGHPSRHGYLQCRWCRCWRRAGEVLVGGPERGDVCRDEAWCKGVPLRGVPGWDANGAPTGTDEQGDAT